jgi:cytochrome c biogenesis protein CcdA
MKAAALAAVLAALCLGLRPAAMAASLTADIDGVRIEVTSTPATPVRNRKTAYTVRLVGAAGRPITEVAVVALGVVQVLDVRMPSLALPLGVTAARGAPVAVAVFLYGFGYALASTGCTLPLYVSITVLPLTSGFSGAALVTFLAFAAAMAVLMLVTTVLVGLARQQLVVRFQRSAGWIKRASGVVLILAGAYLGYYYVAAGM